MGNKTTKQGSESLETGRKSLHRCSGSKNSWFPFWRCLALACQSESIAGWIGQK